MENLIFENTVVSIREITPANAARILEDKNTHNRRISGTKVSEYAESMKRGEWVFNGDSIRISSDGVLLDGQHRLTALVKSCTSQHFIVVENMQKDTGLTIDTGKVRCGGDVLSIELGVSPMKAGAISGAIKVFNKHEKGLYMSTSGTGKLTNTQVVEQYKSNSPLINKCYDWIDSNIKKNNAITSRAEMLAALMIIVNADEIDGFDFAKMVFCGMNIVEECPQSMLRDYLMACRAKVRKSDQSTRMHTIVKVWNSVRAGRKIKHSGNIVFRKGGDIVKKAI